VTGKKNESSQPNKPKDAGAEGDPRRKRLSEQQREALALLSKERVVVPESGGQIRTLNSLVRKGLVKGFRVGGASGETRYKLAGEGAGDREPKEPRRKGQFGLAGAAERDMQTIAPVDTDLRAGDLVTAKKAYKGTDVEGCCIRKVLADGFFSVCVPILGQLKPMKLKRSRLTRVGRGNGRCDCEDE
jgi:hypothetical protein